MGRLIIGILVAFMYTSNEGTLSYTDELKRVPAKYREQAERVVVGDWVDYPKLTIVEEPKEEK